MVPDWHDIFNYDSVNETECISSQKSSAMLRWTIAFFLIALIAAFLGYGGIAAGAASIARICFFLFLVLFVLSLLFGNRFSRDT